MHVPAGHARLRADTSSGKQQVRQMQIQMQKHPSKDLNPTPRGCAATLTRACIGLQQSILGQTQLPRTTACGAGA